jgi:hypothetical protein
LKRRVVSVSPSVSHPRPRPGTASRDVILAAAVALCSGSSDSTQKLASTGDLHNDNAMTLSLHLAS